MAFNTMTQAAQAWELGSLHRQPMHKTATPTLTGAGYWGDLSMAAGMPKYNAYVGNQYEFTPMLGTSNFGINTGGSGTKYLSRMMIGGSGVGNTMFPANIVLADYVGFWPLVDMDSTDYQEFITVEAIPRYSSGLRLMIVCTTPQNTATPIQGKLEYLNQDGIHNTANFYVQAANVGQINNYCTNIAGASGASPFVQLAPGDHSVTGVLGVTLFNSCGGFAAFVLVKPLASVHVPDSITPVELDFPIHRPPMPKLLDGAYFNIIYSPVSGGTVSGIVRGMFNFIRS